MPAQIIDRNEFADKFMLAVGTGEIFVEGFHISVLPEPYSFSFLQFPAACVCSDTVSAVAAAFFGVGWDIALVRLELHPAFGEVIWVRTWKIPPSRKYDPQIGGNDVFFSYVIVDQLVLFGEAQEACLSVGSGEAAHSSQEIFVRDIAGAEPSEEPIGNVLQVQIDVSEEAVWVGVPEVEIPLQAVLDGFEDEAAVGGVAQFLTGSVFPAGLDGRQVYGGDSVAEFGNAVGYMHWHFCSLQSILL